MKKNVKQAYAVLGLLICILLVTLCVIKYRRPKELRVGIFYGSNWDVPGTMNYDVIDHCIEIFNKKYPDVKVTYETGIPYKSYSEWIHSKYLVGDEPDVFLVLSEDFEKLASTGALLNLSGMIKEDKDLEEEDFYESAYSAGTYQGVQYALPYECNPTLMFVNKSILDQEGIPVPEKNWRWNDFLQLCEQVTKDTDGDGEVDQFGFYDYNWMQAAYSNNCTIFSDDGSETLVTENAFAEATRFIKKLKNINQGHLVNAADYDLGHVAFRPLTFSEYRTYMPYPWRIKKYTNFEWTCVTMPAGIQGFNHNDMDVLMAGISSRTTKLYKAWDFLKILTSDDQIQTLVFEDTSGSSALKSVVTSPYTLNLLNKDSPGDQELDLSLLADAIQSAVVIHKFSGYEDALLQLDALMESYLASEEDNTMAMFRIKNTMDELLKDMKQ